jgi:hypothetical protein
MPATVITAIAATKQKPGSKDVKTVFHVIVFALDRLGFPAVLLRLIRLVNRDKNIVLNHSRLVYRKVCVFAKFREDKKIHRSPAKRLTRLPRNL